MRAACLCAPLRGGAHLAPPTGAKRSLPPTHPHDTHAAAYGGHGAVEGNQIFVHLRSAAQPWPPVSASLRVPYEATIAELKHKVATALGVAPEQQQLFWRKRELTAADDGRTLAELNM